VAASPDLDQRAACSWSRWCNHALFDGNNRIGCLATVVFYVLNDIALEAPDDDAYDLVIGVASGAIAYGDAGAQLTRWH
jgi:death on curing protein